MMTTLLRRIASSALLLIVIGSAALLATGHVAYVSTKGTSMLPTYEPGDFVLVVQSGDYAVGQNVMYRDPDSGVVALHRIIGGDADGFVMRGDNNQSDDPHQPTADEVIGRQLLHVPALGGLLASTVVRAGLALALLSLIGTTIMPLRRQRPLEPPTVKSPSSPVPTRGAENVRVGRTRRVVWGVLVAIVALLVPAVALSFVFGERPNAPDESSSITLNGAFSYRAEAPTSKTYPEGVALTGEPVFRQLADRLDAAVAVTAVPAVSDLEGSGRLDLELVGASGWSSRVTLVDDIEFIDGTLTIHAPIDLDDIDDRVQQVADETGLPMTPVNVRLVARVDLERANVTMEPSEMAISFQLNGPVLRLNGPAAETPRGDAVTMTDTISPTQPIVAEMSGGVPPQIRLGLLVALFVALGALALAWPSRAVPGVSRVRISSAVVPESTALIELIDRLDLEAIADRHNSPVLVRDDGWEGVATATATYWVPKQADDVDTSTLEPSIAEPPRSPCVFPPPRPAVELSHR